MALAFLRIADIQDAVTSIIADSATTIAAFPNLTMFFEYFNNQWMNKLSSWNISNIQDHRTISNLEGWHFYLNAKLSKNGRALGFWVFVEMIGKEAIEQQQIIDNLNNGMSIGRRSKKRISKETNIARMQIAYSENKISVNDFISGLVNNF
jgi:hypothetical protein